MIFQLNSKEVNEHCYPIQLSISDAEKILALLKIQEPQSPVITENAYGWKFYHCPGCGREFVTPVDFCDKCGKAVKWDG